MTVCHMILGRPWQFDKNASHDGHSNIYTFKWNDKMLALKPMTPSQIIADNAQTLARFQTTTTPTCETRGERESHHIVSESHKPPSEKTERILLATKSEMRELCGDPTITHYVLICKGEDITNSLTSVPPC